MSMNKDSDHQPSRTTTILCSAFRATSIAGGQIRLEVESATPDAIDDRLSMKEIAKLLGKKSTKTIDKLSKRKKNPLPIVRGRGCHPFGFRSAICAWLTVTEKTPNSPASVQSLFSAH